MHVCRLSFYYANFISRQLLYAPKFLDFNRDWRKLLDFFRSFKLKCRQSIGYYSKFMIIIIDY